MQELASEALASALYNMPFSAFLGERPDDQGNDVIWFRLSRDPTKNVSARTDPKQVMIAIRKAEAGLVVVQVAWLNLTGGGDTIIRGEKLFRVGTIAAAQADVQLATEKVILGILEIYSDVLGGIGVAGPLERTAPPSEAGDPDDPDDMAVPLQE